jgi:hypothetical protein
MPTILFTALGSGSWVKPSGVTRVEIECWGAGGNGGSRTSIGQQSGGGGGGSYSANMSGLTTNYAATEMVVPYYIAVNGSGEDTTWGKNSSAPEWNIFNRVRARPGTNGTATTSGTGGSGGDGTTLYAGGNGAVGIDGTNWQGGGGGAAGENGPGNNASGITGGSGSGQFSGNGGGPNAPTLYGAGGQAGASGNPNRFGTPGLIRIQYADPATQFQLNPTDVDFATEAEINPTGDYNLFIKL